MSEHILAKLRAFAAGRYRFLNIDDDELQRWFRAHREPRDHVLVTRSNVALYIADVERILAREKSDEGEEART